MSNLPRGNCDPVTSKGMVFRILLACIALVLPGSLKPQSEFRLLSKQESQSPRPATTPLFACVQSRDLTFHKNRVVTLHGPDWVLELSVKPSCLPEREVVFAAEVGKEIIPHPFIARTKLWVIRNHSMTHVRIVDSSAASREQEMIAVSFVTNHKCINRGSENCSVKGNAAFIRVD